MIDSLKKIFERFSFTDENSQNEKRLPIVSRYNINYCFKKICNYVNNNSFENIIIKEDYYEIFYVDGIYEVTFILLSNKESTLISCHVFSKKRGKSRDKLYEVLSNIENLLNERVCSL